MGGHEVLAELKGDPETLITGMATLQAAEMTASDIAHVSAYVTDRGHMAAYMKARDEFMAAAPSAPT